MPLYYLSKLSWIDTSMQSGVKKLFTFMNDQECQYFLDVAQQSFFEDFAYKYDCETLENLKEKIGEQSYEQLYPCLVEFFFSNDYEKRVRGSSEKWNVVDLFMKKRGALLTGVEKEYLRSMRNSYMSLYEVIDIDLDKSLTLRNLLEDKEPITVFEKSLTRCIDKWQILGARICAEGGKPVLAGGCLPIDRKTSKYLIAFIRELHDSGMSQIRAGKFGKDNQKDIENSERLMKVMWAKEIANAYMEDVYDKLNREIQFQNTDGHDIQYCTMEFKLNADFNDISALLDKISDFDKDEDSKIRKFWNWYEFADGAALLKSGKKPEKSTKSHIVKSSKEDEDIQYVEVQLNSKNFDRPARNLGTIELLKNKLIAQANSRERAEILEEKLYKALGEKIGKAKWKLEDSSDSKKVQKSQKTPVQPNISSKEMTEIVHKMFREHYEQWVDTPLPILNNKTPIEMCKTPSGKAQVIDLLKDIENSQRLMERQQNIAKPIDLKWLWKKLGLEKNVA